MDREAWQAMAHGVQGLDTIARVCACTHARTRTRTHTHTHTGWFKEDRVRTRISSGRGAGEKVMHGLTACEMWERTESLGHRPSHN